MVGDLPAVRPGPAEHQQVAHPQPVHRLVAGEDVAGRAQLADRVDGTSVTSGRSYGRAQSRTGSTANGWL